MSRAPKAEKTERRQYMFQPIRGEPKPKRVDLTESDSLKKMVEDLRDKEEIYIEKLMHYEEGFEKQHDDYMKLQELYTELFASYKNKEDQIAALQVKFRDTDRNKHEHSDQFRNLQMKLRLMEEQQTNSLAREQELIHQVKVLTFKCEEAYAATQKALTELSYYKNKGNLHESKVTIEFKMLEELESWQKEADKEKEERIKLQYENEFLRNRNKDLEQTRGRLQKGLKVKQAEIIRLRDSKIQLRRENSEKKLIEAQGFHSPTKSTDSNRSFSENRRGTNLLARFQEENKRLRSQVLTLKQQLQGKMDNRKLDELLHRSIDHGSRENAESSDQYFSFSKEKGNQQELPEFPEELEIEALISKKKASEGVPPNDGQNPKGQSREEQSLKQDAIKE